MPFEVWNPATVVSRGFVTLALVDAVADINAPSVAEVNDATTFECSTESFDNSSSADATTIDWLCSTESESIAGSITHTISPLKIKLGDAQTETLTSATFAPGSTKYIVRRDGKAHETPFATGDKVWVWEVKITSVDPAPVANAAGDYIALIVNVTVVRRNDIPVAVSA